MYVIIGKNRNPEGEWQFFHEYNDDKDTAEEIMVKYITDSDLDIAWVCELSEIAFISRVNMPPQMMWYSKDKTSS